MFRYVWPGESEGDGWASVVVSLCHDAPVARARLVARTTVEARTNGREKGGGRVEARTNGREEGGGRVEAGGGKAGEKGEKGRLRLSRTLSVVATAVRGASMDTRPEWCMVLPCYVEVPLTIEASAAAADDGGAGAGDDDGGSSTAGGVGGGDGGGVAREENITIPAAMLACAERGKLSLYCSTPHQQTRHQ